MPGEHGFLRLRRLTGHDADNLFVCFPHAQAAQTAPRPLYRPRPQGFQLAWPWDPEAPFPLPPVFCFARVQSLGDRPYLVFQFQPGGIPRIEE